MRIKNKILLITKGIRSFGTGVLRKFINKYHFKEIRIFSRDENKQDDIRNQFKNDQLKFYIGTVRDLDTISINRTNSWKKDAKLENRLVKGCN
ncbi:polysaccharide biosynthesis protein [Chryseobacterium limigenitum]|uniref:UDP-glucose 4-epimerase n=1 Tax=Chryseobacterium limigenitum TaxID=1612149 RepID=A0A1K2IIT9_9FLAO|nr:UDP-glucose 4-epimerase [Chryseobacterium limigenitum]